MPLFRLHFPSNFRDILFITVSLMYPGNFTSLSSVTPSNSQATMKGCFSYPQNALIYDDCLKLFSGYPLKGGMFYIDSELIEYTIFGDIPLVALIKMP